MSLNPFSAAHDPLRIVLLDQSFGGGDHVADQGKPVEVGHGQGAAGF